MSSSFDKSHLEQTSTRLGTETFLKGELKFENSMKISGRFNGKISSGGFLYIEDGAEIEADIFVHDVVIGGMVRGNIEAEGMVEMLETAKIYGNVRSAKLRIADGVVFEGRCEMIRKAESLDIFSAPVKELRENIQQGE
jgi:cytoskeletal protein CcmA (bactofilin family)